ncbi:hypothetical protein [Chromobacterium amazonense]|uniref:hypothetical protein n=1 Tax=Chromobacterium amazonense TaxID=1382803 RepID=UPI0031F69215
MTIYNDLIFKTRLEAQWAAFFDLAGWDWRSNPAPVGDWCPDFRVTFPCDHSECRDSHTLLVSVVPTESKDVLAAHPARKHCYEATGFPGVDAGAAFGSNPEATVWEFSHGAGGGVFEVPFFVEADAAVLWKKAGELVR